MSQLGLAPRPTRPAPRLAGPGARGWALLRLELRVQWRYGLVALVAGLGLGWAALLAVLPAATARAMTPWVLLLDTAVLGTTLAGALVILERDQGMRAVFRVSPARAGELLAAKVGLLAGLVLAAAVPIALAGRPAGVGGLAAALAGVGGLAVLTMLVAVAVAAHRQSVLTFMIALPLVLLPLVAPALAHAAGLGHPLLYAVPTVGAVDLVQAGYGEPAAGLGWSAAWLLVACGLAGRLARRQLDHGTVPTAPGARPTAPPSTAPAAPFAAAGPAAPAVRRRRPGPVRAFLRTDAASIRRDPLLVLIALSPLLLGLATRFGYPPAQAWLADAYGFPLDPYRPLLLAVAVVVHVPVTFGMIGALMVLDDSDSRALVALRVSPLTLPRYLGYRAGLVTMAAVAGLAVAVPLSGLADGPLGRLLPPLALAALLAPLVMLVTLALANNKVEGVAVFKLLGLPGYGAVAAWWWDGPAGLLLTPLPTWWVLQALWTPPGPGWVLGGTALTAGLLVALAWRTLRRLRRAGG